MAGEKEILKKERKLQNGRKRVIFDRLQLKLVLQYRILKKYLKFVNIIFSIFFFVDFKRI